MRPTKQVAVQIDSEIIIRQNLAQEFGPSCPADIIGYPAQKPETSILSIDLHLLQDSIDQHKAVAEP